MRVCVFCMRVNTEAGFCERRDEIKRWSTCEHTYRQYAVISDTKLTGVQRLCFVLPSITHHFLSSGLRDVLFFTL